LTLKVVEGRSSQRLPAAATLNLAWLGASLELHGACYSKSGPLWSSAALASVDQHISATEDFISPTRPGFGGSLPGGTTSCNNIQFVVPTGIPVNQWYFLGYWINRTATSEADPTATDNISIEQRRLFVMGP
jgi:hypothetical protein